MVGVVVVLLLTLVVGSVGYVSLGLIYGKTDSLVNNTMPGVLQLDQVKDTLSRAYGNLEKWIRTKDPALRADVIKRCDAFITDTDKWLTEYEGTIQTDVDRTFYSQLVAERRKHNANRNRMIEILESEPDDAKTYDYMDTVYLPQYRVARDLLLKHISYLRETRIETGTSAETAIRSSRIVIASGMALAVAASLLIAFFIIRRTNRVLINVIKNVDDGSSQVAAAASEVSSASNTLAASIEETSSSLEAMSSMTAHNAETAQKAKAIADVMRVAAGSTTENVKEMQTAMDAIKKFSAGIS